jgi:predicted ATP-dependent protease
VLPIGGVKEKVLGAHRAGIRRVLLPSHNEADLDDIPADLRKEMQLVLVESIDQVLREALTPAHGRAKAAAIKTVASEPAATNRSNGASKANGARKAGIRPRVSTRRVAKPTKRR